MPVREPASVASRTAVGFPAAMRLNRMGRRFSSHGPMIACAGRVFSHALHVRPAGTSAHHRCAAALGDGISAAASASVRAPGSRRVASASSGVVLRSETASSNGTLHRWPGASSRRAGVTQTVRRIRTAGPKAGAELDRRPEPRSATGPVGKGAPQSPLCNSGSANALPAMYRQA